MQDCKLKIVPQLANEACVGNFHSSRKFLSNYSLIIIHYSLTYLTKETTQKSTADFHSALHTMLYKIQEIQNKNNYTSK